MESKLSDIQTEESVLAHLIGMPEKIDEVRGRIDADSFYSEPCRMIWKAIVWTYDHNHYPDLAYLQAIFRDRDRKTDLDHLNRIAASPTSRDILQQADLLDEYRKRRVYHDLRVKLQASEDGNSKELDAIVQEALDSRDKFTASTVLDKTSLMQYACDVINANAASDGKDTQIKTGIRIIDDLGGLPPESEIIVAAFSSQGKTALAMTIIDNAMRSGVKCAIYSAEMGKSSIVARFLNMMGWGVPVIKFKTAHLLDNTIADFNRLAQEFIDRPGNVFVDDSSSNNVDYICSSIRVLHRKQGIRLVMVDYLQIIALYEDGGDSDQEKLARCSRKLQALAKQLNICIMVLSQFSRPLKGSGHQPSEDLIRGSGQIYEACDISLYIYRPEKWEEETYPMPFQDAEKRGTAMIKIGKYRDGESGGSEICGFDGFRTLFYEFPPGQYDTDIKKNYPKASSTESAAPADFSQKSSKPCSAPSADSGSPAQESSLPF